MKPLAELMQSHYALRKGQGAGRWQLPVLSLVQVAVVGCELQSGLRNACGKPGWLRFPSRLCWTRSLEADCLNDLGTPLAGEWTDGASSWRIVPGQETTALRHYVEGPDGDEYLRQSSWVLARGIAEAPPEMPFLEYAIYWDVGPDGRARRAFDRFLGFAAQRQDEDRK